jgi:arsenate reductase-like glutaredoxin family protein
VLDGVRHLHVAKGKKIESFDLKTDRPSDDELLGMMLGRSGKLRAPALRTGETLVVGFNQDVLSATLL